MKSYFIEKDSYDYKKSQKNVYERLKFFEYDYYWIRLGLRFYEKNKYSYFTKIISKLYYPKDR